MSKIIDQFDSKFSRLTEQAVTRFEQGGYINGDYVKLRSNYKSSPFYKEAADHVKAKIDELAETDLNIRISGVKSIRNNMAPVVGNQNAPGGYHVDLAIEIAPGLYPSHVTVPVEIVELVDTADAMGRVSPPESQVYKNNVHGAEEVETTDIDRSNPKQDTKLPNSNNWQDTPGGGNAPKKSIFEKKDPETLEEAYDRIGLEKRNY